MPNGATALDSPGDESRHRAPGEGDCWNHIGVSGDQSCSELDSFIHCRNCPVTAAAARRFFDRRAPEGYLAEWSRWLADSASGACDDEADREDHHVLIHGDVLSILIFRLGEEWLAFRTETITEVTLSRPVHRVPHRSNSVLAGLVNLHGQVQICISLHDLLGVAASESPSPSRLVVLRDCNRAETWAFGADLVLGVRRISRSQWRSVPSTLINMTVGFCQAVLSWNERSVGLLDEQRVFTALRSLNP
jgi:chemotaxis-related protein WspD